MTEPMQVVNRGSMRTSPSLNALGSHSMSALLSIALVLLQAEPAPTVPPVTTPPPPPPPVLVPDDPTRPALLREGTFITRATGTLDFDDATQSWIFRSKASQGNVTGHFPRVFGLLPSIALDDMIDHVEHNGAQSSFEVTARVLLYNGRNFLLPSMATPFTVTVVEEPDQEAPVEDEGDQPVVAPANSLDQDDGGLCD